MDTSAEFAQGRIEKFWDTINIYDGVDQFQRSTADVPRTSLLIYAANFCLAEVQNGGFAQLFCNSTGILMPLAIEALGAMDLTQLARVFLDAAALLDQPFPMDRSERCKRILVLCGINILPETWTALYDAAYTAARKLPVKPLEKQIYELFETEAGGYSVAAMKYISTHPINL